MRLARGWLPKLLLLAACLAALTWTIAALGPRRVVDAAWKADPSWLVLSVLAVGARYLVWGVQWTIMMRRRGEVGFLPTLRALLCGVFVNLTTPTAKLAGGFVRAALIHRETGWGFAASYGWSLADQVTNSLGNVVLAGVLLSAAAAGLPAGGVRDLFLVLGSLSLAGTASVVAARGWAWRQVRRPGSSRWLARITPARFRIEGPDGPVAGWVEPVFSPVLHVGRTRRVLPLDLGLAALSSGFLCASNVCALRAVGVEAPFVQTAAATVLAGFVGTVVGTVGGIGATELALIGLYDRLRLPSGPAAAAVFLHGAAYYLVSLGVGGAALLWEGRRRAPGLE